MEYIEIGKAVNTHGLKGELKIESWSDFDEIRYQKGNTVYLHKDQEYIPSNVYSVSVHKVYSVVSFEGYEDINLIEQYKGYTVCMSKEERHPLPEGEYYADELNGFAVVDEDGKVLGTLVDVEGTSGAQNNFRVQTPEKRQFLVPNVPEFIKSIDTEEKRITIHVEEGLL